MAMTQQSDYSGRLDLALNWYVIYVMGRLAAFRERDDLSWLSSS